MAPQRTRKRNNTTSSTSEAPASSSSQLASIPTKLASPAKTPARSPSKRKFAITQAQKQALIDNLQLEITERARKLRAQYALQAQALKTRLEVRVHRIPGALRNTTIAELLERYAEQQVANGAKGLITMPALKSANDVEGSRVPRLSPLKASDTSLRTQQPSQVQAPRLKRSSAEMEGIANKENGTMAVSNPKKRTKTAAAAATQPSSDSAQAPPRLPVPKQVLSPRSANARAFPPPLVKDTVSPAKSYIARPLSPLKPSITASTSPMKPFLAVSVAPIKPFHAVSVSPVKPSITMPTTASTAEAAAPRGKAKTTSSQPTTTVTTNPASKRTKRAVAAQPIETADGRASAMSNTSTATTITTKGARSRAGTTASATTVEKEKRGGLAGKLAGLGAKGKKAAAAVGMGSMKTKEQMVGGSVRGGRILRKRA